MTTLPPSPFPAAVQRFRARVPVASRMNSAAWAQVPVALRERAFFSATVEKGRAVESMRSGLEKALAFDEDKGPFMDRSRFVAEQRETMERLGLSKGTGGLSDVGSIRRQRLIYDHNVEDAMEYGRWKAGQDPDLLAEFPAQELIRVRASTVERPWRILWREAGGKFPGGRMIARKDDPIWTRISRFGKPWPPFDFGSGMGVRDIDVDEAEELGVVASGETVAPTQSDDLNFEVKASTRGVSPEARQKLRDQFGDVIQIRDGQAHLEPQRLDDFVFEALAGETKGVFDLGAASPLLLRKGEEIGVDFTGARLRLERHTVTKVMKDHGPGATLRAGEAAMQPEDFRKLPWLWRDPETVRLSRTGRRRGGNPTVELYRADFGYLWTIVWQRVPEKNLWSPITIYKGATGAP